MNLQTHYEAETNYARVFFRETSPCSVDLCVRVCEGARVRGQGEYAPATQAGASISLEHPRQNMVHFVFLGARIKSGMLIVLSSRLIATKVITIIIILTSITA